MLEAAFPADADRYYLPMSIGRGPADAGDGAALILDGAKTAAPSPFWDHPDGRIPFGEAPGVLLDGGVRPCGTIRDRARGGRAVRRGGCGLRPCLRRRRADTRLVAAGDGRSLPESAARNGAAFSERTAVLYAWIAVERGL